MLLATMPPALEIREEFKRDNLALALRGFWSDNSVRYKQGEGWKDIVFSRIAKLERGDIVAGFGDFNVSERAAGQVRLKLAGVALQSLPLPAVVPISGNGMVLTWTTGSRAVEITAFADGELAIDALEHDQSIESFPEDDLEQRLKWLITSSGIPAAYATTR